MPQVCLRPINKSQKYFQNNQKSLDTCMRIWYNTTIETETLFERNTRMSEKETYTIVTVCSNCGHTPTTPNLSTEGAGRPCVVPLEIPKGTEVWPHVSEVKCENCGCIGTLMRR